MLFVIFFLILFLFIYFFKLSASEETLVIRDAEYTQILLTF